MERGETPRNTPIFYGWWIVLVAFICHAVNTGMIFYAWGVFFRPLAEAFGGHAPVASGFSVLQFAAAGYSLLVGRAVDRHGARPVEIVGALVRQLATCRWVHDHHNVLITGMTGTGKSYLACALAQQACRRGYRALCRRVPRLYEELTLAHADGGYIRLLARFARVDVLVIE